MNSFFLLSASHATTPIKQNGGKDLILAQTNLYIDWVESLKAYANSPKLKAEYPFWQKIINQDINTLLVSHNLRTSSVNTTVSINGNLNIQKTHALLKEVPSAYNTKINDILLTALALTITKWLDNSDIYISMEGHGRELINKEIDISRTLGWFTSIFPIFIHLESKADIGLSIQNVKEVLNNIPENGIGYSIIRYLSEYKTEFRNARQPEICFNYLGQWDNHVNKTSLFDFATEAHGNSNASENQNLYLLNINSLVKNGQFQINWKYSTNHFTSTTIQNLVDNYIKNLEDIINHCIRIVDTSKVKTQTSSESMEVSIREQRRMSKNALESSFLNDAAHRQANYMIPLNPIGYLNPFFCIHPIDGDIHWLHKFAKKLNNNRPFIAIENISLPYELFDSIKNIETLAKLYISEIKNVQPKGPYYIGGWSFGAVVAFEIAKLLESEGEVIENLILFDQYPINPMISLDIINKIEADKDINFKKAYQDSKKNLNDHIQNNLIEFKMFENPNYKYISSNSFQYMKASTSAYFLNRNLLKVHTTTGKVKRIISIVFKKTYTEKSLISVNPWEPFCDKYIQYIIEVDHNSIFQEPFVGQLLDILLNEKFFDHD